MMKKILNALMRCVLLGLLGLPALSMAMPKSGDGAVIAGPPAKSTLKTIGTRVGLTILVDFPNWKGTIPQQDVNDYCNKPGYTGNENKGSVFDYFYKQSGGRLRYYNVVTPYVTVPYPYAYYRDASKTYGDNARTLLRDALEQLIADGFDFSSCTTNSSGGLHGVNLFYAGFSGGKKGLWPHTGDVTDKIYLGNGMHVGKYQATYLATALTLGTFCHENGHLICRFPDLYDGDFSSTGNGHYSLMSSKFEDQPASVGAYLRYRAGWAEVFEISSNSSYRASVRVDDGPLYQYLNPAASNEYFLIENRAKIGREAEQYLPSQGLMIMHGDEKGSNNNEQMSEDRHYQASIEQAAGRFALETPNSAGGAKSDLFRAGGKTRFDDTTLPNAHWWKNATSDDMTSGDPSGLSIRDIGPVGETMTFIVGADPLTRKPSLGVDRSLLEVRTPFGQSPPHTVFAVWNLGKGTVDYSITSRVGWAKCSPTSGRVTTESDVITITYETAGLAAGTHLGKISIVNDNNPSDIRTLNIQLTVENLPALAASTIAPLTATCVVGRAVSAGCLNIKNTGEGVLEYKINSPEWVLPAYPTGAIAQQADIPSIEFSAANLTAGTYNGTMAVQPVGILSTSPVKIPVRFHVKDFMLVDLLSNYSNGETMAINWQIDQTPRALHSEMDIQLWKDGSLQQVIASGTENDGIHEWPIPSDLPNESNYTIRLSKVGSSSYEESAPFAVWIHHEGFEGSFKSWENSTDNTVDWRFEFGPTKTSFTGPSKASEGSQYLYLKPYHGVYKTGSIFNRFNLSLYKNVELKFDYHMYGSKMGNLHVDISSNGKDWDEDVRLLTGQQHTGMDDPWSTCTIDLTPWRNKGRVTVRIRGELSRKPYGDMAIDNLGLRSIDNTVDYTLTVNSSHGSPEPKVGSHILQKDTIVTSSVDRVITVGKTTRYTSKGWSINGLEPSAGNTHTNTFTLTNDATLTWLWSTNYYLTTAAAEHGTVSRPSRWSPAGRTRSIGAVPGSYYHFDHWEGDASGHANPIRITMDTPKSVTAYFAENLVTNNIPEWWLAANGLGITDADALADSDGDGLLNWEEFYAGTIVTNPASAMRLTAESFVDDRVIIKWQGVTGKSYSVLHKENLSDPIWKTSAAGIPGIEPECTHTVITENASSSFIRILLDE